MRSSDYQKSDYQDEDNQQSRRDSYRTRRPDAPRSRSRRSSSKPGGIRQRRNKHWSW